MQKAKAYRSTTYKKKKTKAKHYKQYTQLKNYTNFHYKHINLYNTFLKDTQKVFHKGQNSMKKCHLRKMSIYTS